MGGAPRCKDTQYKHFTFQTQLNVTERLCMSHSHPSGRFALAISFVFVCEKGDRSSVVPAVYVVAHLLVYSFLVFFRALFFFLFCDRCVVRLLSQRGQGGNAKLRGDCGRAVFFLFCRKPLGFGGIHVPVRCERGVDAPVTQELGADDGSRIRRPESPPSRCDCRPA